MDDPPPATSPIRAAAAPRASARFVVWLAPPWRGVWLPALLALVVAELVRHLVVEPAGIAHACDLSPWQGWCGARMLVIQTFATMGLGWVSLAAGLAATVLRSRVLAQVALVFGMAGLVLYCFELSVAGALMGLLVLARRLTPAAP